MGGIEAKADAGVVDEDVHLGEGRGELSERFLHFAAVAHVEEEGVRVSGQAGGELGEAVLAAAGEDEPGAGGGEELGAGGADAGAGAGDEGGLAREGSGSGFVHGAAILTGRPRLARAECYGLPMSFQTCPTDIVEASVEKIWELVTTPDLYESWVDAKLLEGPDRPLVAGDRLVLGAGLWHRMKVLFDIVELAPREQVVIDARLPFGLVNHEVLRISPLGPRKCRVTFN